MGKYDDRQNKKRISCGRSDGIEKRGKICALSVARDTSANDRLACSDRYNYVALLCNYVTYSLISNTKK